MAYIKLEDLYLSKDELKDIRTIKINRAIDCIKFLKSNLKIRKE